MLREMRQYFMEPRPRWNSMGPRLPCWFRKQLKRVDKSLHLQFMVPSYVHPDGVAPSQYPLGVWIVSKALKRTGWLLLHSRWTWSLSRPMQCSDGMWRDFHRIPTRSDIKILRLARDLKRRGKDMQLEEEFDESCRALQRERVAASREKALNRLANVMRECGMTQHGGSRISVPAMGF